MLGALALALATVYAVATWLGERGHSPTGGLVVVGVAVLGGLLAIRAWALGRRAAAAEEDEVAEAWREAERLERARRAEKEHARELRAQVAELHRRGGPLADPASVPELVLRTATRMLDAEKGLLLSRRDADGDGRLDLLAVEGFEHDPNDSELVQRFATRVIERDTTVREDEPHGGGDEGASDEEIRNLVAIPIYMRDEFNGVVVCANREGGFEEHEDHTLIALGDHAGAVLESSHLRGELRRAYLSTVAMLAEALEVKDPFLRGHSEEVARYVQAVARGFDLDERRRELLVFASLLHDVGKLGISEQILAKPGPLTDEERAVVNLHPRIGSRLVEQVPALRPMTEAILHHHERYDGGGYPIQLKGEQIPLEARIICVADSFSAMTAERPYRGRMSVEEACAELERCAGTQFDPAVVEAFVAAVRTDPPELEGGALTAALDDPEVRARRAEGAPLLGVAELGSTDSLTMLYSHSYWHSAVAAEVQRSRVQGAPLAIALIELTDIDALNRRDGYGAGDAAIRAVARAVSTVADRVGGVAARHGGRRLALTFPGQGLAAAEAAAAEVERDVSGHSAVRWAVAEWRAGESGEELVERAWAALRGRSEAAAGVTGADGDGRTGRDGRSGDGARPPDGAPPGGPATQPPATPAGDRGGGPERPAAG